LYKTTLTWIDENTAWLMTLRVDWLQKGFKSPQKFQKSSREKFKHVVSSENQTEHCKIKKQNGEAKPRWHDFVHWVARFRHSKFGKIHQTRQKAFSWTYKRLKHSAQFIQSLSKTPKRTSLF